MLLATLAVLGLSAPAAAEPLRLAQAFEAGALPPYEVLTIVRSAGFDPLGQPFRRGPNYVLRAIGGDDREVRVVVSARSGDIVRVVPIETASRVPPRGGVTMGPYERMDGPPPGYVAPAPRGYGAAPPADYEDDAPEADAPRPPAGVPGAPPRASDAPPPVISATPPRGSNISRRELPPPGEPHVITATESPMPSSDGLLPPPPERFPQRAVAPAAKPKPVKRAAAAPPKQAPLPKPRPGTTAAAPQPAASVGATPDVPPAAETKADDPLPN
jgi:hypothetical protein